VDHGTCDKLSHYVSYMMVKKDATNSNKLTKCDNFGYIVGQNRHKWQLKSDNV